MYSRYARRAHEDGSSNISSNSNHRYLSKNYTTTAAVKKQGKSKYLDQFRVIFIHPHSTDTKRQKIVSFISSVIPQNPLLTDPFQSSSPRSFHLRLPTSGKKEISSAPLELAWHEAHFKKGNRQEIMSFFFLCVGLKLRFSEVDRPSLPPFLQIVRAYRSGLIGPIA